VGVVIMTEELKSCPFCGSRQIGTTLDDKTDAIGFTIYCLKCKVERTKWVSKYHTQFKDITQAINQSICDWNERYIEI
jgi:transcription elongation factor Elf1